MDLKKFFHLSALLLLFSIFGSVKNTINIMKITQYNSNDFKTGKWSGGTTTELYISPAASNYADLNFDIRISSAKVEIETSTFTNLPEVNRQLMILDGEITITHLKPLDVDTFKGDWNTTSQGVCTDFNVMTRGNTVSELSGIDLVANQTQELKIAKTWKNFCIYLFSGSIAVTIADKTYTINSNSFLVVEEVALTDIKIYSHQNSRLALVTYNTICNPNLPN